MLSAKTDKHTGEIPGTGRRKSSVARVRVKDGEGKIMINKRPFAEYFANEQDRNAVLAPLRAAGKDSSLDIRIRVQGGGQRASRVHAGWALPGHWRASTKRCSR
jgi:small subunit ribosomal protein S9